jgi:hypothetical protein
MVIAKFALQLLTRDFNNFEQAKSFNIFKFNFVQATTSAQGYNSYCSVAAVAASSIQISAISKFTVQTIWIYSASSTGKEIHRKKNI